MRVASTIKGEEGGGRARARTSAQALPHEIVAAMGEYCRVERIVRPWGAVSARRGTARVLALTAHYATQYGHGEERVTRVQPALLLLRDEGVVSYEQDADE